MNKVNVQEIEARTFESPKKHFCTIERSITKALNNQGESRRPFEVEYVTVPPGKKAFTYHVHGTQWEFYYAIKGSAHMRVEEGLVELKAGDAIQFPPGVAHQLINDSDADFEYWIVASNQDFETCYYPDSDKVSVHAMFGANKGGDDKKGRGVMTQVGEGLITDYWHGEE